nr:hypothetical protein [Cytophagales bacterium]
MQLLHITNFALLLSGVAGIVAIKRNGPFHLRVVAVLVVYTCLVELSLLFLKDLLTKGNNLPVYNFIMLVLYMGYAYFFRQIVQTKAVRRLIDGFLYLFPVFWFYVVFFIFKIDEWNSYVYIFGGAFTVLWAVTYCFELFTSEDPVRFRYSGGFWIAVGLIFFYSCGLPYMGMFNFLTQYNQKLANTLKIPLQISNIVMYLMFSYAFLCQLTDPKKS